MSKTSKTARTISAVVCSLALLMITIGGAVYIATKQARSSSAIPRDCSAGQHVDHKVIIQAGIVQPHQTTAHLCDKLTITNLDASERLIAFGLHENHQPYGGIEERLVAKGQSLTVTLDKTGNFRFHDHLHDEVQGTFSVRNR